MRPSMPFSLDFNQMDEIVIESEKVDDVEDYEAPPMTGFSDCPQYECFVFVLEDCLCLMDRNTQKLFKKINCSSDEGSVVNLILFGDHLVVMHVDGPVSLLSMKQLMSAESFNDAKIWTAQSSCVQTLTGAILNDNIYIIDKRMGIVVMRIGNGSRNDEIEKQMPIVKDGIGITFASEKEMIISTTGSLQLWNKAESGEWHLTTMKNAAKERGYLFLFNIMYEESSGLIYAMDCDNMCVSVFQKSTLDVVKTFGEDMSLTSICLGKEKGLLYCCYNTIVIYN